jgi:hypothetical protein
MPLTTLVDDLGYDCNPCRLRHLHPKRRCGIGVKPALSAAEKIQELLGNRVEPTGNAVSAFFELPANLQHLAFADLRRVLLDQKGDASAPMFW